MFKLEVPERDVVEICVLGRGLGEAVILHMGDGDWIVIDSFHTKDNEIAPLAFLEELGLNAAAVKLIVATHWHDDHVTGISELYRHASEADFVFPAALERDEFAAFVGRQFEEADKPFSSGVQELLRVSEIREGEGRRPLVLAAAGQTLFVRHASQTSFHKRVELAALSPSSWDVANFLRDLQHEPTEHATRMPLPERNHVSVACWAHFADFSGILGADLVRGSPQGGWNAVLAARTLPEGKADYFKIPHHGSENAHSDEVWASLLSPAASAVLAPWIRGGRQLPKDSDVARIKTLARQLYTAKSRVSVSYKPSFATLGKLMTSGGALITSFPRDFGFVRFRRRMGAPAWTVTIGGGAAEL